MQAAAAVAAKIVSSVTKVGDVLLSSMEVGSPPITVNLPAMSLDVRKDISESLVKGKVQSDIGSCKINGALDTADGSCVTAQVTYRISFNRKLEIRIT